MTSIETKPSKKKKIASIILFVFAAFWFAGTIGWFFIYAPVSEDNTTPYTATITNIQPVTFYQITVAGHNAKFGVFFEDTVVDMDALSSLATGQTITFRIKNSDVSKLNDSNEIIYLISLEMGGTDIITIESYNKHSSEMRLQATLGFVAGGSLCLIGAVLCLLWHKGKIGRKQKI